MTRKESLQNTILDLKALIIVYRLQENSKLKAASKAARLHLKKMNFCLKAIKLSELKPNSIKLDFHSIDNLIISAKQFVDLEVQGS